MPKHTADLRELQKLALSLSSHGEEAGPSVVGGDPRRGLRSGFHELVAASAGDETVALAFALSFAMHTARPTGKSVCFCRLKGEAQEYGQLYGTGLGWLGVDPRRVLMVAVPTEKDLLWTLEEAVGSGAFGAVMGALPVGERLYDFTTSRRLKLRSTAKNTPLYLIRHRHAQGATAAHGRWRLGALPSEQEAVGLVGVPRLRLGLERMGGLPPQHWEMMLSSLWEDEIDVTRDFHLAPLLENRQTRKTG